MRDAVIVATKALIVLLFAVVLLCQVWAVPEIAASFARSAPEFAALRLPGVLMVGALLVCVEVVLVCVWRLLSLTAQNEIFDEAAFRWVDAVIAAVGAAWLLIIAGLAVLWQAGAGGPAIALAGLLALITAAGLALVVVVMRGLLRSATALRREMSEVV